MPGLNESGLYVRHNLRPASLSLSLYIVIVTFWLEYGVGHQS